MLPASTTATPLFSSKTDFILYPMQLGKEFLRKIVHSIKKTREDEIDCNDCFDLLDSFAEMELRGTSPEEAMPLVQDHLKRCKGCEDEYLALLEALKELETSS